MCKASWYVMYNIYKKRNEMVLDDLEIPHWICISYTAPTKTLDMLAFEKHVEWINKYYNLFTFVWLICCVFQENEVILLGFRIGLTNVTMIKFHKCLLISLYMCFKSKWLLKNFAFKDLLPSFFISPCLWHVINTFIMWSWCIYTSYTQKWIKVHLKENSLVSRTMGLHYLNISDSLV